MMNDSRLWACLLQPASAEFMGLAGFSFALSFFAAKNDRIGGAKKFGKGVGTRVDSFQATAWGGRLKGIHPRPYSRARAAPPHFISQCGRQIIRWARAALYGQLVSVTGVMII